MYIKFQNIGAIRNHPYLKGAAFGELGLAYYGNIHANEITNMAVSGMLIV